jgi:hypothetical protein
MAKNGFCSHFGVVSFVQLNVKVTFHFAVWAGAALLAGVGCVRAEDQIQVYTIPKEHPAAPLIQAQMSAGASDIPVNSAPVRWTTPAGWRELPPDGIRLGSFAVTGRGGKAEVAITSFPGTVGTELDNVNRWRGEVQLEPIGQNDLSAQPVTVDSCEGKLFDIAGTAARTVVAVVPRNGSSWFFKMKGDSTTVTAARPAYLEFPIRTARLPHRRPRRRSRNGASRRNGWKRHPAPCSSRAFPSPVTRAARPRSPSAFSPAPSAESWPTSTAGAHN